MPDLRDQLQQLFQGRVCLMGLGNEGYGDDGFGVRLAEALKPEARSPKAERRPKPEIRSDTFDCGSSDLGIRPSFGPRPSDFGLGIQIVIAGKTPERWIGQVADSRFDHILFLDAVDFGGAPGSTVLLNSAEMIARFPQISTHKISLGLLAKQAEANTQTEAWLLGVQPASLRPGEGLSPTVQATLRLLHELLNRLGRTSDIQYTTSNTQRTQFGPSLDVGCSMLDVGCSPGSWSALDPPRPGSAVPPRCASKEVLP
jgi:hydrogenase maturation protease